MLLYEKLQPRQSCLLDPSRITDQRIYDSEIERKINCLNMHYKFYKQCSETHVTAVAHVQLIFHGKIRLREVRVLRTFTAKLVTHYNPG